MSLSNRKTIGAILAILIVLILFFCIYYFYLQPKKSQLEVSGKELTTEEKMLAVLQENINKNQSSDFKSTAELQKRIPVKALEEQLILEIEKAEIMSNSIVSTMSFGTGEQQEATTTTEQDIESLSKSGFERKEDADKEEQAQQEVTDTLPSGVQKSTISLSIKSPTYRDLETFISTIENSERVMIVENLAFTGKDEITSLDQPDESINYTLTLSAFYMPTLTDLSDQTPQIETLEPSNKKNPFNSFGDVSKRTDSIVTTQDAKDSMTNLDVSDDSTTSSTRTTAQQEIIKYTVQPGDTIFSISMKFYNSRDGEQLIKEKNQLTTNIVKTGQLLEIPLP